MNSRLSIIYLFRDFDNMTLTGKADCLTVPAYPLHETPGGTRSIFIEGLKDVVAEKGELNALRYHLLAGGCAQREVELEARRLRHVADLLRGVFTDPAPLEAMMRFGHSAGNGGAPMRYGRLVDLVKMAMQMQGRADGLSLDDIGEAFEVSRRTAERMRDALRDAFPQIEELAEPSGRKRWRLPPGTIGRLADPTLEDIYALHRGVKLARQSGDFGTADHLEKLSDRLRARLSAQKRTLLEPDIAALLEADGVALRPGPRERIPEQRLDALRQAILAGVWIKVDHRAQASGLLSRNARIGPLAMLLGEGRQYLVAFSEYAQDVRLFALAGFERIELADEVFERPESFDLQAWLQRSFGVWQEEVFDVVWRFTPEAARDARLYMFHPTQVMTEEPDGSLTVSFRAGGLREMCWHLFRWGDQVKIIAPTELQLLYHELVKTTV